MILEVRDLWPAFLVRLRIIRSWPVLALLAWLESFGLRYAHACISVSPAFSQYLEAMGRRPKRLTVIPSGADAALATVDAASRRRLRSSLGVQDNLVFLYTGSFNEAYSISTLLEAACLSTRKLPRTAWKFGWNRRPCSTMKSRQDCARCSRVADLPAGGTVVNMSKWVFAGVIGIATLAGSALGNESDFAALRQQVAERLEAFRDLTSKAKETGLDVSREQVTITTAEIFLSYADWDVKHPDALQASIATWWQVREKAGEISRQLPLREMRDVMQILDNASRELTELIARPSSRRTVPRTDSTSLVLADGYFHCDGRPTFPSSFIWMPEEDRLHNAYGEIGGTYIAPSNLQPNGAGASIRYRPQDLHEPMGYVFLGHSGMPSWVRRQHPEIEVGSRHFTAYDIDHPATREVWRDLLSAAVPKFAGRNIRQGGYLLANEPHWFSASGEWDTGPVSDYTQAKFRTWLQEQHRTIGLLNQLWDTQFASFADVVIDVPVDAALRGTPMWYDWCRFNMHRVTDWFSFLKAEIRRHDPQARTHIKLIPSHFARAHALTDWISRPWCDCRKSSAVTRKS